MLPERLEETPCGEGRTRRAKGPDEALVALMRLCARAEKSSGDALRLMRAWGVEERARDGVLRELKARRFIDDVRFAEAFVREKTRLDGWGVHKIRAALLRKGIAATTADAALGQVDRAAAAERLAAQLTRKMRTTKYATPYELKGKLMRYGLSLGYDYEAVADAASRLIKDTDSCDDLF